MCQSVVAHTQTALTPILRRLETVEKQLDSLARGILEKLVAMHIKERLDAAENRLDRLGAWMEKRLGSMETLTEEHRQLDQKVFQLDQIMREFEIATNGMMHTHFEGISKEFKEVKKDSQLGFKRLETDLNELKSEVATSTKEWAWKHRAAWSRVEEVRVLSKTFEKDFKEVIKSSSETLEELLSPSSSQERRKGEKEKRIFFRKRKWKNREGGKNPK